MTDLLSTLAEVVLYEGYQIVFEALDPVTGAAVAGVLVNNGTITCEDLSVAIDGPLTDNVVPLLTPITLDEQPFEIVESA